jgi:hypothetical protein
VGIFSIVGSGAETVSAALVPAAIASVGVCVSVDIARSTDEDALLPDDPVPFSDGCSSLKTPKEAHPNSSTARNKKTPEIVRGVEIKLDFAFECFSDSTIGLTLPLFCVVSVRAHNCAPLPADEE